MCIFFTQFNAVTRIYQQENTQKWCPCKCKIIVKFYLILNDIIVLRAKRSRKSSKPTAQFEIEEHSKSLANITWNSKPLSSNNTAKNYLMQLGSNASLLTLEEVWRQKSTLLGFKCVNWNKVVQAQKAVKPIYLLEEGDTAVFSSSSPVSYQLLC